MISKIPPPPPPPPTTKTIPHLAQKIIPHKFDDFKPATLPNRIQPSFVLDFQPAKIPNKIQPSFSLDFKIGKDENYKYWAGDSVYSAPPQENKVYYEMGLKGMTPKDMFIQRLQNENGEATPFQAKLNARENGTTPSEEFLKLYNASKVKGGDKDGSVDLDLGGSKIVIAPAIVTKTEEETEEAKNIISKFLESREGKKEQVVISEDFIKNELANNLGLIKSYKHPELDAILEFIPKTDLPKGYKKFKSDEKRELIKKHFETNKGIENPEKMTYDEKRELFEK